MCGSATFAIVVSTPCMNVASMIEAVIAVRLVRGPTPSSPGEAVVRRSERGPRMAPSISFPGQGVAAGDGGRGKAISRLAAILPAYSIATAGLLAVRRGR